MPHWDADVHPGYRRRIDLEGRLWRNSRERDMYDGGGPITNLKCLLIALPRIVVNEIDTPVLTKKGESQSVGQRHYFLRLSPWFELAGFFHVVPSSQEFLPVP